MPDLPKHFSRSNLPFNKEMKNSWEEQGFLIIDNFKLKSSLLTSGGPIYEDISVYNVDLK